MGLGETRVAGMDVFKELRPKQWVSLLQAFDWWPFCFQTAVRDHMFLLLPDEVQTQCIKVKVMAGLSTVHHSAAALILTLWWKSVNFPSVVKHHTQALLWSWEAASCNYWWIVTSFLLDPELYLLLLTAFFFFFLLYSVPLSSLHEKDFGPVNAANFTNTFHFVCNFVFFCLLVFFLLRPFCLLALSVTHSQYKVWTLKLNVNWCWNDLTS